MKPRSGPIGALSAAALLSLGIWMSRPVQAEVLGTISDDTAAPTVPAESSGRDDRKIVYRVICTPEDHDLPDCDQSTVDGGVVPSSANAVAVPDLPADAEDDAKLESAAAEPAAAHARKSGKSKKAGKKTGAKSSTGKKRHR
ncbi:hypothetical protein [Methylomonas sp. UP202]|uniref:hypothetical protein n=1 Tax=Methylomonas sp. UP202 TaxID=3040943 RepID=UPI00247B238A|nr:hypothetical protein [Methylomonas sp. UP202]WGS86762.1 hypothetical protein QC632_03145 [Methylomonas sp. UP202]